MSTLLQLWREVCGRSPALVNQEGKHLIVSESDCALLGSELERAAPTPAAQSAGQEAVAWRSSYVDPLTCARVYYVAQTETRARDLVAGRPYIEIEPLGVIAAPVNGGERELGQVIDERDQYHDAAEKLADAIAKHFGVEIGEHSNLNCPWQNALDHIAQATKRAADAQQVGGDEHANRYRVEKASGGFWPNAVRCGTGTRELFVGQKRKQERTRQRAEAIAANQAAIPMQPPVDNAFVLDGCEKFSSPGDEQ